MAGNQGRGGGRYGGRGGQDRFQSQGGQYGKGVQFQRKEAPANSSYGRGSSSAPSGQGIPSAQLQNFGGGSNFISNQSGPSANVGNRESSENSVSGNKIQFVGSMPVDLNSQQQQNRQIQTLSDNSGQGSQLQTIGVQAQGGTERLDASNQHLGFQQNSISGQMMGNMQQNLNMPFAQQQFLATYDQNGNLIKINPQVGVGNFLALDSSSNQMSQLGQFGMLQQNMQTQNPQIEQGNKRFEGNNYGQKMMCGKCKNLGHAAKDCKTPCHCIICGKETHKSEDCAWLKQIKPVAKYVGYAAKGLGCLLVQNVKEVFPSEHVNPMAQIEIISGTLNETQLIQAFSCMFSWNWQWRTKAQGKGFFLMRFPSKAKLMELMKFREFNLLGTDAIVSVSNWTPESQAKGKLHTVWVKVGGVPDCLRHFFGMCEIGSALGPVLEIDMDSILQEEIRIKVGVRDVNKIPEYTEITTKDLYFFDIFFSVETVVEQGWFNCNYKRAGSENNNIETANTVTLENAPKKPRTEEESKTSVSLGSMSLAQFEAWQREINKNVTVESLLLKQKNVEVQQPVDKQKDNSEEMMKKLKQMEEEFARQAAKMALEEKKWQEVEIAKKQLETEMARQSELLRQAMEQLAERNSEEVSQYTEPKAAEPNDEKEEDDEEQVDYNTSQDSIESFRSRMEQITGKQVGVLEEKDSEDGPRRCDRFKPREDSKIEDLAKERAAARNNYDKTGKQRDAELGSKTTRTGGK